MKHWGLLAIAVFALVNCGIIKNLPPYTPTIVFDGEIDGESMHLPGYLDFPNDCHISGDSLVMDFYSDDYDPSTSSLTTSVGTFLRIKVFPQPGDTVFPFADGVSARNCQVHYVVHSNGGSCSYDITPADTQTQTQTFSMHIEHYDLSHGAAIAFSSVNAVSRSLTATCSAATSGIRNGTINGTAK